MKKFQNRKLHGDLWNENDVRAFKYQGIYDPDAKNLVCTFKAWDDDDILYLSGTIVDDPEAFEDLYYFLKADSGVTRVVFYKKGKIYDEIS